MLDGYNAPTSPLVHEVLAGLTQPQKTLPAKLFYDAEGCRLFGEITRLPEYYLTRTEQALLETVAPSLPAMPGCALVEYGASDEAKAVRLLEPHPSRNLCADRHRRVCLARADGSAPCHAAGARGVSCHCRLPAAVDAP